MKSSNKKSTVAKKQNKGYNKNTEQYRVMCTIEEGVLSNQDVSIFYDLIGDKKRGLYFPRSFEGETIFEIDNKLVYADADYKYPSISKVISFDFMDKDMVEYSMEVVLNNEEKGYESRENLAIAESFLGEGTVSSTNFIDSKAYRREKDSRRKRGGGRTSDIRSGKDVLKSKPDTGTDDTSETYIPTTSSFEIDKADKAKLDEPDTFLTPKSGVRECHRVTYQ